MGLKIGVQKGKYYHVNFENHYYFSHLKKLFNMKNIRCIIHIYLSDATNKGPTNHATNAILLTALNLNSRPLPFVLLILATYAPSPLLSLFAILFIYFPWAPFCVCGGWSGWSDWDDVLWGWLVYWG